MSYQEYSQLGRGRSTRGPASKARRSQSGNTRYSEQLPRLAHAERSKSVERPYLPSHASFSVPRASPPDTSLHSATSSTSSASLRPSNSASQNGWRSTTHEEIGGQGGLTADLLAAQLKELEAQDAEAKETNKAKETKAAQSTATTPTAAKKKDLIEVPLPWRPYYLQRKILSAFFAIFAAAIISLEALLDYSSRNAGLLGETNRNLRYLWALVPAAVLTLIASLWSRVEFQAKTAAPWRHLARGPTVAEKTVLLDYFTMAYPRDIIQAAKNGDTAVACISAITILLKIAIVVATALIRLTVLDHMDENSPITLQSRFVDDASGLSTVGAFPMLTMLALERDNATHPNGTSRRFAFQHFRSDMPSSTQVQAVVDGFSANITCETAQATLNSVQNTTAGVQLNTAIRSDDCSLSVPIVSKSFSATGAASQTRTFARFGHAACGNGSNGSGSSDPALQRIVVFLGTANIGQQANQIANQNANQNGIQAALTGSIAESQQLICKPVYSISQVNVVMNDTFVISVSTSTAPEPHALANVQPWDIAQAFFDSHSGPFAASIADTDTPYFASNSVNVDPPMYLAFGLMASNNAGPSNGTLSPSAFLDAGTLQNLSNAYFQQYTAIVARQGLMAPDSIRTTCAAVIGGDRLIVGTVAVQIVVVLLAIVLLLSMVVICTIPGKGLLPRDPHSILDVAAILSHSQTLLQTLRGTGGADQNTLRDRLNSSYYYTGVEAYDRGSAESSRGYFRLFGGNSASNNAADRAEPAKKWPYAFGLHPAHRVVIYLFVAGLIAALEVTLRVSESTGGFATVSPGGYTHFLWTMIPALVMAAVALLFVATDFHVRALAPFMDLARKNGASFASISKSLLDKTAGMAVLEAAKQRNWSALGASAAVSLAVLLPIFSATLFSAVTIPASSWVQLAAQDVFSNSTSPPASSASTNAAEGTMLASLVLNANLSDPAFTFHDLAFPRLLAVPLIGINETDDLVIKAIVPAVRSAMACRLFPQADVDVNLTTNYRIGSLVNPLRINLPGEPSLGNTEVLSSTLVLGTAQSPAADTNGSSNATSFATNSTTIDPNAFFGLGAYRPLTAADGSAIPHWVYAWGQLSGANTNQAAVRTITGMACNESMQQVDTRTTFFGSALTISPHAPPQPIESTARVSDAALSTSLDYANLANVTTSPHLLDAFFGSLVSSRAAIPVSELGMASSNMATATSDPVAQAIVRQHGLLRAQVLSAAGRQPTTESSRTADLFPVDTSGDILGNATAHSYTAHLTSVAAGRRRLLQDTLITRTLQALLGAVLVFSVCGWLASSRTAAPGGVLPRAPTSIASVAALLADGNLFGFLGRGPEWQTTEELKTAFRDGLHVTAGFTLGWEQPRRRTRRGLGGGGGEEGPERFGINAVRTGGWGGGENVGLGLQARVGYTQREYVRDWGWRT